MISRPVSFPPTAQAYESGQAWTAGKYLLPFPEISMTGAVYPFQT
jgi:hypothetical protein